VDNQPSGAEAELADPPPDEPPKGDAGYRAAPSSTSIGATPNPDVPGALGGVLGRPPLEGIDPAEVTWRN
jgi:hypothetical protein